VSFVYRIHRTWAKVWINLKQSAIKNEIQGSNPGPEHVAESAAKLGRAKESLYRLRQSNNACNKQRRSEHLRTASAEEFDMIAAGTLAGAATKVIDSVAHFRGSHEVQAEPELVICAY
jgi:hypothetical protein